jgi:signal transduction histidine kinase/ActR/RegA family two-component response regulator
MTRPVEPPLNRDADPRGQPRLELSDDLRHELLDAVAWREALERCAPGMKVAVALADTAGRLSTPCINPQPFWSRARAASPARPDDCPFCLGAPRPCVAVLEALRTRRPAFTVDAAKLTHAAVPLLIGSECLGLLLAGQVFHQFPEQLPIERAARELGASPQTLWQIARKEVPFGRDRLELCSELLATFGQSFLHARLGAVHERLRSAELLALSRDVVEHRRLATAVQKQNERLNLLSDVAEHLLAVSDAQAMVRGVFRRVERHLDLDALLYFTLRDEGGEPQLEASAGSVEQPEVGVAVCRAVALERRPVSATHVHGTPLLAGESLLGALAFASRRRAQFEADELEFMRTLGHYVAVAAERIRLIATLTEADRRKSEFLAMLGHELRNPLAPIHTAVQILRQTLQPDTVPSNTVAMVDRQVRQMVRLVDDLLDVSRISQGKIELKKERAELGALVRHAVEAVRPIAERTQHVVSLSLPADPIWLHGDPARLVQVIGNLLTNAFKYSEVGETVWLSVERSAAQAVVRVRDNGIGLAPDQHTRIFEMFMQVDGARDRAHGGLGIGLSLAKTLVEMHGGAIAAHSEGLGHGAEFRVRLPCLDSAGAQPVAPVAAELPARRILVVDDNRDAADCLATMLELGGHEVHVAHDGVEAIEQARAVRPDLILLDIGLPKFNGYEAARRIREHCGRSTLLVALTGWGQDEDRRKSREAGFDAHMTKPLDLDALARFLASAPPTTH